MQQQKKTHFEADLSGSLGLVIGSEGSGLRRLVRENCDFLIKIPMKGELGSLNASVAAAVIIYEIFRQRG
nr:TrmH family RNA methyltransferase [Halanaerobium congolense]